MAKIHVLGSTGMLGSEVLRVLREKTMKHSEFTRYSIDLNQCSSIPKTIEPGEIVINCAAYTNVSLAEKDLKSAFQVNAFGPAALAKDCADKEVKFIYVSSDYVFDGRSRKPYRPNDVKNPLQAYGQSKDLGEKLCIDQGATVVRTSWLYGAGQNNFVSKVLERLRAGERFSVVNDQHGVPTSTSFLAENLIEHMEVLQNETIVHFVPRGVTTWFDFARQIAETLGPEYPLQISSARTKIGAHPIRPKYSALEQHRSLPPQTWQEVLVKFLKEESDLQ